MEVAPADWEMTQQPQAQMKKAQSRGQEQWHHPLLARQNTALETAWDQVASLVNRRGKGETHTSRRVGHRAGGSAAGGTPSCPSSPRHQGGILSPHLKRRARL